MSNGDSKVDCKANDNLVDLADLAKSLAVTEVKIFLAALIDEATTEGSASETAT